MADRRHLEEVEAQAALFALGALPVEEAAPFQQRVNSGCPLCCAELKACETAASALTYAVPEVAPPAALRMRLLDSVGGGNKRPGYSVMGVGKLVRPADTDWEPTPVQGVHVRRLHERNTMLVRMAPKTVYPAHHHKAAEQCLVLEGSVNSCGLTAYAGDYTFMPAGSHHDPLSTESGCLLLIAYT